MTIHYKLKFLSYWHCGSGLSGGAEADTSVIKDSKGLPFVPGKTIKGLMRDAAMEMSNGEAAAMDLINRIFGFVETERDEKDKMRTVRTHAGSASFSNAELSAAEQQEAGGELSYYLYDVIASTSIDEKTGTAMNQTLRSTEVVVPLELYGTIQLHTDDKDSEALQLMKNCLKWVRAVGAHRNRGLGRCSFTIINESK